MPGFRLQEPQNGLNGHNSIEPPQNHSQFLITYLSNLLQIVFGVDREDFYSNHSFLSPDEHATTVQLCQRFLTTTQTALYAQKLTSAGKTWPWRRSRIKTKAHRCAMFRGFGFVHLCSNTPSPAGQDIYRHPSYPQARGIH